MDVTLALLADAANVTQDGKLNVLGTFDSINASTFPCTHPMMHLVMRFESHRVEIGQTKQIEIRLVDSDGGQLGSISGSLQVPDAPPGNRVSVGNILPLANTQFPAPGAYSFVIMINGEVKAEIRLTVTDTKSEVNHDSNS